LAALAHGEPDAARQSFERALALEPAYAPAHHGLAEVYELPRRRRTRGGACCASVRAADVLGAAVSRAAPPVRVLLLVSARGGDLVANVYLDDEIFQTYMFAVETYRDGLPLPEHDVVFCAIGDADRAPAALVHAARIAAASGRPLVNDPGASSRRGVPPTRTGLRSAPGSSSRAPSGSRAPR